MIVVKVAIYYRQIAVRNTISKFSIISPLSKNQNRDKLTVKSRQYLDKADGSSPKNHITKTQKQTKISKSAHKLHSLHPFI
jgi:hypothetical protein